MRVHQVIGASVAIVDGQSVILTKGYGYRDLSTKNEVNAQTLFSMQSISKTITTTAFLKEVEDGNVKIDDKIIAFYPELKVRSRSGDHEADKMTFRHLLSHRAGFCHEAPLGNNYDTVRCSFDEHIAAINGSWLRFGVNEFYSYSNMGHDLVAYAMMKRSKKTVDVYLKEKILLPLGMINSTYSQAEAYRFENIALGYFGDKVLQKTYIPNIAARRLVFKCRGHGKISSVSIK